MLCTLTNELLQLSILFICQIQDFSSEVRMAVYICLVVVALLVQHADSAKCVYPDEYEFTLKSYFENVYYETSISNLRHMMAFTKYTIDKDNKTIVDGRTVNDYNLMVQFDIPADGGCIMRRLNQNIPREIPDNAVEVDHFPLVLPNILPEGTEYWRYNVMDRNEIILGVLRIRHNVCALLVKGRYSNNHQLIPKTVAYITGKYSLIVSNKRAFDVPPECLP